MIGGYAGSGKTELGRIIARLTGWPLFDKDSATRPVVEMALVELGSAPSDRESNLYLSRVRPAEYEALRTPTAENVARGNSAIMTAPFIRELRDEAWTRHMVADAEALGATLRVIWIRADAHTMQTYIRRRGAARDTHKLAHWNDYLHGARPGLHPDPALRRHRQLAVLAAAANLFYEACIGVPLLINLCFKARLGSVGDRADAVGRPDDLIVSRR